ncbi:MAG: 4-hydroxythreonine-4-phosphate dehydrogenase PdxA [Bacillota bacterium]|nr:4-hydroxythreonine-4-phosphate dehydrogenase PdxA [Bacillota bacterium]
MNLFGITMGDPCGIGAEVILKAFKTKPEIMENSIVFGSFELLKFYNAKFEMEYNFNKIKSIQDFKSGNINVFDPYPVRADEITIGKVSALGGKCAFLYVKSAIDFALEKKITSVVTAPLNKEALHLAGYNYAGHTEIFAEFAHGDSYAMLLWSDKLKAIHASTHISLRNACDNVSKQRTMDVIHLANETLKKTGYENPRIAVAGLNPHAGENGLFGDEEIKEIIPGISACQAEGINVSGPIAPDTVFLRAYKGEFDIVVAQYHDQGHIPLKLLAFDSGVNITVGLDVIRTSVDHGTAFDIAGTMTAREDSILKAIEIGKMLNEN